MTVPAATKCRIVPVRSRRDRRRFIDLPFTLYDGNPYWVPPLRLDVAHTLSKRKNPFFEHGSLQPFLAVDESDRVVGRIAGIVNGSHLKKYDDGLGFFGFFECEERFETAEALLDAAAAWLRKRSLTGMRGPANPTLNDVAGLLTGGFDRRPSVLMPYNPAYYEEFLARWGMRRAMTMWAYYVHGKYVKVDRLRRGAAIVRRRNPGLRLRTLDMSRYGEEARVVRDIFNEGWSNNWGFVPTTQREFARLAKDMKSVLDPRLVLFVEKDGEPAAVSMAIPNVNEVVRRVKDGRLLPFGFLKLALSLKFCGTADLRMPLMGVRQKYQGRAFDILLVLETIKRALEIGYHGCEMGWVLDTNSVLRNLLVSFGAVIDKEYALFDRDVDPEPPAHGD